MSTSPACGDAELVRQSRAGDAGAFGQIVARYQTLISSLTYNATGNLSQSEDLAQETFITAWKQLPGLREPDRLRSWLCGIARNLCHNLRRRCEHEPAHAPEPLETVSAAPCPESLPSEQTISREEEAILWRALERIPAIYREPLILFYREHQSVEQVAQGLELSTDAVRQRLARGRKMLQENVAGFVEGALQRTGPGKTFTVGVLAALPVFAAGSATGATIGAAGVAVKATTAAKTAVAAGLIGALLGPLLGVLGGAAGAWMSIRNTASARERQFMIRQTWISAGLILVFIVVLFALTFLGRPLAHTYPMAFGCALALWFIAFWTFMLTWIVRSNRRQKQIRIEDGTENTQLPPLIPIRRQQFLTVYGSLGGGTVGVLAWMVAQAVQVQQPITAAVTVLFGTALVLVGGRAWTFKPQARVRVLVTTLALLGLFTAAAGVVHWHDWTKTAGAQVTGRQAVLIGSTMAIVSVAFRSLARKWLGLRR